MDFSAGMRPACRLCQHAAFSRCTEQPVIPREGICLQDATGGICLRLDSKTSEIALGDTIYGTGKRAEYNKLPQLGSGTFKKSSGLTLTAKATTIGALTDKDVCGYVKLKGLEITEIYDNNGQYTSPNVTLKDADGKTIQLYKAVMEKKDGKYIRRERYEGQCSRSFYVGEGVQAKDVNAKFEDGILKVSVPKAAPQVETDNVIAIE